MEQEKNQPKTYKTIAIRITALVLAIWLVFMICLTWAVAKDFQNQMQEMTQQIARYNDHIGYGTDLDKSLPGYEEMIRMMRLGESYQIIRPDQLLPFVYPQTPNHWGSDDWFFGHWELVYGFQPAVIFYDEDRNVMMKSGNISCLTYCSRASWVIKEPQVEGICLIDLDALSDGGRDALDYHWGFPTADSPSSFYMFDNVLRLTGYFEGNWFIPISVDRASYPFYSGVKNHQVLARYDHNGALDWENRYTAEAPEGVVLTTIYSWEAGGYDYDHSAVTVNGKHYDSQVDLLEKAIADEHFYDYRRENLFDSIMIFTGKLDDDPDVGLYALAIRCWPMQYAALRLIPTYLVSLALVAVTLWLILRSIRRNVADTLEMLIHRIEQDAPIEHLSHWKEPYALESILKREQEQRRQLVNDNQQLQKSLEFAKNAEENRRQLVSNITHELKTPLAIIHSYAEGLQSGIAEEKREKYLSTILEEAERMDAMVLEMLDHSRLESGKVKLSADHFSLWKLTESIAEKLTPAMEEKGLMLSWGFCNDCMLTADESRLAQVVTNLFTNAIRYTPEGGVIHLRVFSDARDATFQIENEAEHLPAEVLEKIFDSFYRADDSRSAKGTGLGLPIARSILQLHRGSIHAMNTYVNRKSCIQFSFTIPLK